MLLDGGARPIEFHNYSSFGVGELRIRRDLSRIGKRPSLTTKGTVDTGEHTETTMQIKGFPIKATTAKLQPLRVGFRVTL